MQNKLPVKPRNKTAYTFFCDETRPNIKKEGTAKTFGEVSKELGRRWKAIIDRAKYVELAEKPMREWEREVKETKERAARIIWYQGWAPYCYSPKGKGKGTIKQRRDI